MYDINNIVSSMFGIEMTRAFSKLSHKKEIQLRKNKAACSSFTGSDNLSEKASLQNSFSKQHYCSYLKLQHKFNFCHSRVVLVTISVTFYNLW